MISVPYDVGFETTKLDSCLVRSWFISGRNNAAVVLLKSDTIVGLSTLTIIALFLFSNDVSFVSSMFVVASVSMHIGSLKPLPSSRSTMCLPATVPSLFVMIDLNFWITFLI